MSDQAASSTEPTRRSQSSASLNSQATSAQKLKRSNKSLQSIATASSTTSNSDNHHLIQTSFSSRNAAVSDEYDCENDAVSPFYDFPHRYRDDYGTLGASTALKHVTRVSKRAALASKKVIWDSHDNAYAYGAAQTAVEHWEELYSAARSIMVLLAKNTKNLYNAAKSGAAGIEHGILLPVRDFILLPAFGGVEWVAVQTIGFLQSEQAVQAGQQSLQLAQRVPFVGPTVLAPSMIISVQALQTFWEIAKYPIPSREQVRSSVDFVLTGTKWTISTAIREISLYVKRADAVLTRTLSHTQWRVLGSGPYETLDKLNKQEVIDHICERYFALKGTVARYELAAHIRAHNLPLYLDLVLTGLLRKRGGELTKDDEWLSSCPSYRKNSPVSFLLPNYDFESTEEIDTEQSLSDKESPLWFRLPYINGKHPGRDTPWVRFSEPDRAKLEERYRKSYKEGKCSSSKTDDCASDDAQLGANESSSNPLEISSQYPTVAQWYVPDLKSDVMVDQKRYSVSFFNCCPRCRSQHDPKIKLANLHPPMLPPKYGDLCRECMDSQAKVTNHWMTSCILSPPCLSMTMRPNLWRFHGPGDEVRRGVWFLDTRRHGLQPFAEEACAILEDAYLFLQWRHKHLKEGIADAERKQPKHQPVTENTCREDGQDISDRSKDLDDDPLGENALLTVQVESPDGSEQQLVQFSSLTSATAIRQGLGGAISLFKRRVYRGADLSAHKLPETLLGVTPDDVFSGGIDLKSQSISSPHHIEEPDDISLDESAIELEGSESGCVANEEDDEWSVLPPPPKEESLAVPASQFDEKDRVRSSGDSKVDEEDEIDHLVLVVHGIGEMLQSAVSLFGLAIPNLSSIIECCGFMRKNHSEVQKARFSLMYPTAESTLPATTGRVEYIPVEWHEAFSIVSRRMSPGDPQSTSGDGQLVPAQSRSSQVMMQDISLRTIPQMRSFANDTLMDVLYFMSTEHHDIIIDIVTKEMNVVVQKFRALTGFDGRISIIGHSLGSIITWDILEHQTPSTDSNSSFEQSNLKTPTETTSYWKKTPSSSNEDNLRFASTSPNESYTPNVDALNSSFLSQTAPTYKYPKLQFDVDNAFMLGSPIAVFLMVRNQRKPLSADFALSGCPRVYNIFHPFDPVSYRLEPCIDPRNADFEPKIMTHWNGGFRVQYQTKRLWRKLVQTTMKTQQNLIMSLEAGFAGLGLLDSQFDGHDENNESSQPSTSPNEYQYERSTGQVNVGKLNQGRRIDYMLQEKEIEAANEYVAAFAAHSCYWIEKDLSLFIARQIYLSRLAHEQALHFDDILPQEEVPRSKAAQE